MQPELALESRPSVSFSAAFTSLRHTLAPILFWTFFGVTALAVFVPLNPTMPATGIDPSYAFAMNQAVARHLSFGKQIVFTYGPYASIVTRAYDPATDLRMMWGSVLLGVSYCAGTLLLAGRRKRYLAGFLLLFFATFGPGELLLVSYPFLLLVCIIKQVGFDGRDVAWTPAWREATVFIVMWSTLGLLPLIKGSLIVPFLASVAIPFVLLVYRARYRQALFVSLLPIAAALTFWLIADQTLASIPGYLHGIALLTSGYTEAMSLEWAILPKVVGAGLVSVFLALSTLTGLSVCKSPRIPRASKWALLFAYAIFLLVVFKHGFIAPTNAATAFASLAVLLLLIGCIYLDNLLVFSLLAAMLMTGATSIIRDPGLVKDVHRKFGIGTTSNGGRYRRDILVFCLERAAGAYSRVTYKRTWNTYHTAWQGLTYRLSGDLERRFDSATAKIRSAYPLPTLQGTADIYDYDQSILLASEDAWNPRPVIQGYSAYTPALAHLDEQHLRGETAPDWIWFDLQTIDGRLPSMDDGVSWPALLDNYTFASYDGRFVALRKNQLVRPASSYLDVSTKSYKAGAQVTLPETGELLFAKVDWKPTIAGRLLTELFNPPELHIVLGLQDGKYVTFRVVSGMLKTEVLLSPLISNTAEFASLVKGDSHSYRKGAVRTISMAPSYGGSLFWSGTYELTLERYADHREVN